MPGYEEQHLVDGLIVTMVDNSPYEALAGKPMPTDMRANMVSAMERIAAPIHEHIVSWWNETGGGIFPDEKVKMTLADPVSGFLSDKIDGDTIIYDETDLVLKLGNIFPATNTVVGGVIAGSTPSSGLFMTGNEIFARIQTSPLLSDSNTEMPSSKAVKSYVDTAITSVIVGGGIGDMLKSTYDTNLNGIVDNAEKLNNEVASYYLTWSNFLSTPTNISGYGITDAYTKTNLQITGQASVHWGNITNNPTTLSGYGITDSLLTWSGTQVAGQVMLWGSTGVLTSHSGLVFDGISLRVDMVNEFTTANGVWIDGLGIKDTGINFEIGATTRIFKDVSNNLSFTDAITGTKTLAELVNAAMVYPGAGIPLSTGSAWGTSIVDNSATWNALVSFPGFSTLLADYGYAEPTHSGVFEPVLGNPTVDGHILSSTIAGVRSWVAPGGGVSFPYIIDNASTNTSIEIAEFRRTTSGTAADGIGGFINITVENDIGTQIPIAIYNILREANNAVGETTRLLIQGRLGGGSVPLIDIGGYSNSIGIGYNNNNTGDNSIAMGFLATAPYNTISLGHKATASTSSVAIGHNVGQTSGTKSPYSVMIGAYAGQDASPLGTNNIGIDSIAIGQLSVASASGSTAFGKRSRATAQGAIMMGWSLNNAQENSLTDSFKLMWDDITGFHVGLTLGTQVTVNPDPDTNLTAAINGVIAYDSTDHQFRGYVNGAWTALNTGGGTMVYPGAGIPLSTGSAWGTSIVDNSATWNAAYGWGNHASAGYLTSQYWAAVSGGINYLGGNVLIGTTTDSGYILDVTGTGRFTGNLIAPNVIYGMNGSGSNPASTTQNVYELPQYKSGFWEVTGAAWTPTTAWYWGITAAHTSNTTSYNYSGQIAWDYSSSQVYLRTISAGTPASWSTIWHSKNSNLGTAHWYVNNLYLQDSTSWITKSGGYVTNGLRIQNASGFVEIGTSNTALAHLYTDRPSWYIYQPVRFAGTISTDILIMPYGSLTSGTTTWNTSLGTAKRNWAISANATLTLSNIVNGFSGVVIVTITNTCTITLAGYSFRGSGTLTALAAGTYAIALEYNNTLVLWNISKYV